MNIWLIYPYGAIPGEGKRPDRAFMIAEALQKAGNTVTWWASSFDHSNKKYRTKELLDLKISPNFTIRLVPTSGYKKNISLKRIQHEKKYARNIFSISENYESPDLIILSEPALFRSNPILKIVNKYQCKLVLDILDIWPELFSIVLPKGFKFLDKFIFKPWYIKRKKLFQQADAIVSVSKKYTELAKTINPQIPDDLTETVYFGTNVKIQRDEMNDCCQLPEILSLNKKNEKEVWAIYASTLGSNYDVKTLLKTAKLVDEENINLKILIAGEGPLRKDIELFIKENSLKRTLYIGNPDSKTVAKIFSVCDVGLSMYLKGSSVTFPIKAFHYFTAGLPIINSLKGDLSDYLIKHNAGIQYTPENHESLFEALNFMSCNFDKLQEMSKNSYNLAMSFDQEIQYEKFSLIIDRLSNGI